MVCLFVNRVASDLSTAKYHSIRSLTLCSKRARHEKSRRVPFKPRQDFVGRVGLRSMSELRPIPTAIERYSPPMRDAMPGGLNNR